MKRKCRIGLALLLLLTTTNIFSQKNKNLVYVDKKGVMRYTEGKEEASFFGVNYTTPFAHAYRAQKALGLDLEQAIRNDVYHFSRLGLQAFRVHVWDTEISDTAGNLINNEHLRLFDFLLSELKKRKIKTIITPIAFWGNGYPERDENTPGFSRYYGRGKLTTNDSAIVAQENYLRQFFKHINPYTQLSYEDDKDIIAVEINNEPSHSDPKSGVTGYINRLAKAIRSTGWSKPVYYNIAQGPYFSDAVAAANIDGVSFQWYPSGLVGNQTLKGNTLMHVDEYRIPFYDTVPAFRNKARMVYEFDAADIMAPYMYPFMAKAFRTAGFQWATQFAYDPMGMAAVNTEYQTHYLNLAYTPAKAISLMIAAEVFSRVPRGKDYGRYPADSLFDVFRVSYDQQLSEMNTDDKFYYSSTTNSNPKNIAKLSRLAGTGKSPVVKYEGSGAYFLDKLEAGVWRLELMPDAVAIRDPFERASPKKVVTAIEWKENGIEIYLPDLGNEWTVEALGKTDVKAVVAGNKIKLMPGIYLLKKQGHSFQPKTGYMIGNIALAEFVAPAATNSEIVLRHQPLPFVTAGQSFRVNAMIAGMQGGKATLQLSRRGGGFLRNGNIQMLAEGNNYSAEVPAELVTEGQLHYRIIIQNGNEYRSYPGAIDGNPYSWDSYAAEYYKLDVRKVAAAIDLFDASKHENISLTPNWRRGFQYGFTSGNRTGQQIFQLSIEHPEENEIMGLQHFIGDMLKDIPATEKPTSLVVRIRQQHSSGAEVKLALVNKWGTAFSGSIRAEEQWQELRLPLPSFVPDSSLLLPRPYPGFQPLFFTSSESNAKLNIQEIEKLQLYTEPAKGNSTKKEISLQIEWVRLEF